MSTEKKPKPFKGLTPRGVFRHPVLNKPDYGNEAFPKPYGVYKVQLILSEAQAVPLLKTLEPIHAQAVEEGKAALKKLKAEARKKLKEVTTQDLFGIEYDKESEVPTGNFIFSFKMHASGLSSQNGMTSTWKRSPDIFDAKGKLLTGKLPEICDGTEGIVAFKALPYFISGLGMAGLVLLLEAVQIIKLRSGDQRSAADYGFVEEDGWSAPEELVATRY